MDTLQLIVTNPDGMVAKGPADRLEQMLLNLCGGGWNANETAEAMRLGQIVRSGGTAEKKGWKLRLETRYTLVVAPGSSQCRLYLMPYPMRDGQHPMHLAQRFQDEWEHVGMLNSQLKVVYLDERLHHLHSELEGSMGGTYFELDEQFQFVDGPALAEGVA
ncbi:hypothetical protein [Stutzerimonas stutzeri]|uniref:hypothetical protein n=1 Tax=Stutzerimonas stutzeri TaxID=316 RepID=UPI000839A274|nr:hypothetical protein [Stutzerimonas stutzeri]OCX57168.1 hypothetical protein BFM99_13950 [Stutzerimonas stutzeri]